MPKPEGLPSLDALDEVARIAEEADEAATTSGTPRNDRIADETCADLHGMLRPEYVRWLISRARDADHYERTLRSLPDCDACHAGTVGAAAIDEEPGHG